LAPSIRASEPDKGIEGTNLLEIMFADLVQFADDEMMLSNATAYAAHHQDVPRDALPATVASRRADLERANQAIAAVAEKLGDKAAQSPIPTSSSWPPNPSQSHTNSRSAPHHSPQQPLEQSGVSPGVALLVPLQIDTATGA